MAQPVRLAEGVWRISTLGANLVNSIVLEEPDGGVTVIDTGYKRGGPGNLLKGLAALGKQPGDVRRILLTHAHSDHAGGAARVQARTAAPISAHDVDAPYLREGRTPHLDRRGTLGRLLDLLRPSLEKVEVRSTFQDNELLDVAGGLRVLHTPGHTPGHCAFLHEPSGVLITGDSLFNFLDRMSYSFAIFCSDIPLSRETADRLGEVDYEVAAFIHGPEMRDNAREQIRDFLRRKRQ